MIQQYGDIKGITPVYDDIMIAFRTNGLFVYRHRKDMKKVSLTGTSVYFQPTKI